MPKVHDLSRLSRPAAELRGHPAARKTRHLPEEELPGLHGEPVLQREQHHRPGKETQAADPQRGESESSAAASGRIHGVPFHAPFLKGPFSRSRFKSDGPEQLLLLPLVLLLIGSETRFDEMNSRSRFHVSGMKRV